MTANSSSQRKRLFSMQRVWLTISVAAENGVQTSYYCPLLANSYALEELSLCASRTPYSHQYRCSNSRSWQPESIFENKFVNESV